jgi:hypothetical protein
VGDPLERLGEVEHVVVALVALAERVELLRERPLGVAHLADGQPELHRSVDSASARVPPCVEGPDGSTGADAVFVGAGAGPSASATLTTLTAPALNSCCLDTGSQSVIVSSLAARDWPSGRSPLPRFALHRRRRDPQRTRDDTARALRAALSARTAEGVADRPQR